MTTALEALLRKCTVLLSDDQGKAAGSGFFVAERLILTAAHVVEKAGRKVSGRCGDVPLGSLEIEWIKPERSDQQQTYRLPDLALLLVSEGCYAGHPAVLFGDDDPGEDLLAEGYTRSVTGHGYIPDSARLKFEALRPEAECMVIRGKDTIVDDGLSGGPLLDQGAGRVIGVTKAQRTGRLPFGGVAVSLTLLRDHFSELWAANARFHQFDHRWEFARLSGSSLESPEMATKSCLRLVRDIAARRPKIVPPDAQSVDVQQIPSVRAESSTGRGRLPPSAGGSNNGGTEAGEDSLEDGVFRWPLVRARWPVVVLSGMPGVGKSYLLKMHAEALVSSALERLDIGDTDPLTMPVPVLVDCATLGRELPERANPKSTIEALIEALRIEAEAAQLGASDSQGLSAVIHLAHADGRLVTCLDALDEAGSRERARVLKALTYLAEGRNRLVLTSRPQPSLRDDTAGLSKCFRAEVVGFSAGQVFAFARAWFSAEHSRAARFETELRERQELRALARVPLLAAFLCQLASEEGDVRALPSSPATLYQSVVTAALSGRWKVNPASRAFDPENPPDPELRLRLLTGVVGRLTHGWRSRVDRFPVSAFDDQLLAQPSYNRALAEANARMAAFRALQPYSTAVVPHPSPVRWEYLFDGLLTHDVGDGGGAMVRFAHPVLGEYFVAAYIAALDEEKLQEVVQQHRWFDASWEHIWSLSAALMPDPEPLIRLFLDASPDAWHEQTFIASKCVAGAAGQVSTELAEQVLSRVAALMRAWRPFDRDRAIAHFGDLLRADLPGAANAAQAIVNDTTVSHRTRLKVAAMLAETGDLDGLGMARGALADRAVPANYRAWLARAVVLAEDTEGMEQLKVAIKGARRVDELLALVAAIPVETKPGGDLVAQVMRDQNAPLTVRSAAGQALIRIGDAQRIAEAGQLAADPVTVWLLRAALISALLAVGEDGLFEDGITVLSDPSVSGITAVSLVENLIRRGETHVLPTAARFLSRHSVEWLQRKRLAEAIAELGTEGVATLYSLIDSGLAVDLKLRIIIALVEVGEAVDIANRIVCDTGEPSWIRTRLARTLVQAGEVHPDKDVLTQLATDPDLGHEFQAELIAAMAAREYPEAEPAALGMLQRKRARHGNSYAGETELPTALVGAGPGGAALLRRIAQDTETAEEDRALALMRLADAEPAQAGQIAAEMLDQLSTFMRSRLVILLAEKGLVEIADEVTALIDTDPEAYTALYKLLAGVRTTPALIDQLLKFGTRAANPPAARKSFKLDDDFLAECEMKWSSDAEKKAISSRIYDLLQYRVGARLAVFLTPGQLEEFEDLSSDEERLEFLASRASGYRELVHEQALSIRDDIRANPSLVYDAISPDTVPAMMRLSNTAAVLAEWAAVTAGQGQAASAEFLVANRKVIASGVGLSLFQLARDIDKNYNPNEGLYYIANLAASDGIKAARRFIQDSTHRHTKFHELLANNRGVDLLLAGLAGLLFDRQSASTFFYASLGATMADVKGLGVILMERSGMCADVEQRQQGLATIRREAIRLRWDAETTDALLNALSFTIGGDSDTGDDAIGDES